MRVLVAYPEIADRSGGSSLTAWTLQALCRDADVTLISLRAPDVPALNRRFGTELRASDFRLHLADESSQRFADALPAGRVLIANGLFMRACRTFAAEQHFDRLVATNNEFDFGRPAIQYVHFPWAYLPRPATENRWFHQIPGAARAFQAGAALATGMSRRRMRRNRTLVNSEFVRERVRTAWGIDAEVVYPPVPGGFPAVDWTEREDGIVCLGRIHREKRLRAALEIVATLRARGLPLRAHLIGTRDEPDCEAALRDILARNGEWATLHLDLPREEMVALVARQRYGLHMMHEEHFGIAVAEMQRAGCITFVPRVGGPAEIVGGDERLLFDSDARAVDTIEAVLRSPQTIDSLRAAATRRSALFSAERFMDEMRRVVLDGDGCATA